MLVVGPFLPSWARFLVTVSLGKGLVVLGLLLLMRTGLVSFGQGLYYAIGAYAAGLAGDALHVGDAAPMVLLGALAAAAVAAVLGLLLARYRGIFFAMLSLAFSMILYGLLVKTSRSARPTGSTWRRGRCSASRRAGRSGATPASRWSRSPPSSRPWRSRSILRSRLGRLAPAMRDNELRVEYMGASVRNLVHLNFVIAAVLAGIGGALIALTVGHIDPEMAYWTTSGEFVFVAILSGTGNVVAPFVGAVLLELLRSFAYEHAPNTWQLVVGGAMLAVILFLPEGLWSLFLRRRRVRA